SSGRCGARWRTPVPIVTPAPGWWRASPTGTGAGTATTGSSPTPSRRWTSPCICGCVAPIPTSWNRNRIPMGRTPGGICGFIPIQSLWSRGDGRRGLSRDLCLCPPRPCCHAPATDVLYPDFFHQRFEAVDGGASPGCLSYRFRCPLFLQQAGEPAGGSDRNARAAVNPAIVEYRIGEEIIEGCQGVFGRQQVGETPLHVFVAVADVSRHVEILDGLLLDSSQEE